MAGKTSQGGINASVLQERRRLLVASTFYWCKLNKFFVYRRQASDEEQILPRGPFNTGSLVLSREA